jgi:hypothetical protein
MLERAYGQLARVNPGSRCDMPAAFGCFGASAIQALELAPRLRGCGGARRRPDGGEVAFVTLTRFDSLDAIRAFAGADYEVPVLEPQALALLSHYDERALHFDNAAFRT